MKPFKVYSIISLGTGGGLELGGYEYFSKDNSGVWTFSKTS